MSDPTPQEAAAIQAAIEQFERDTAPPPSGVESTVVSPWVRAARLEGVDRDPGWVSRGKAGGSRGGGSPSPVV